MKFRLLGLLAPLTLLAACGRPAPAAAVSLRVVAEFYPLYVDLLNVADGVPGVQVANLVPTAVGCPEGYQLSPQDLRTLSTANVLVVNGAGLENYLGKVAAQYPQLTIVDANAGQDLLKTGGELNPHLWVSPAQAARQVQTIAAALAAADPVHAAMYTRNGEAYAARLAALAAQFRTVLAHAPIRRLVAFHDSLPYLARDLGLEIIAVIEPAPGQNPSARELADVAARVRSAPGPVALLTELDSKNPAAEILSRELRQPVYCLDTVTAGPLDPAAAKDAYLRAMDKNLAVLATALGVKQP
ncbi:MAG TPA: zinc ABC transporter substrate-binding protein [Opitutales bacterium]|nr:zinc ABC transporter substrate-binding protein [Opitutales bacterium]